MPAPSPESNLVSPSPDPAPIIHSVWSQLQEICHELEFDNALKAIQPAVERFQLGIFRLVIMGEIKKGKSTFLNALLGEENVLPTASDVATSTVFKVMYGPAKKFKVFFAPDVDSGVRQPPVEISENQVVEYGTEAGNRLDEKRVDFIGIELPHPLLREGLVLVDTPGVGGLFLAHRDITWRYAPNADAIFFVLDSVEAVISKDEITFLQDLTDRVTKRVFFVQTKIDAVDTEQWQSWRKRNEDILVEQLKWPRSQLKYFPLSAKLKHVADKRQSVKHLEDSGYLVLTDFLQHGLMRAKQQHMAAALAQQLLNVCAQARVEIGEQLAVLKAGTRDDVEQFRQQLLESQKEFENWQKNELEKESGSLSKHLSELRKELSERLLELLDPTGPITTKQIERLQQDPAFTPQQLNESAGAIQQACIEEAARAVGEIQKEYNNKAAELTTTAVRRLGSSVPSHSLSNEMTVGSSSMISMQPTLGAQFTRFDYAKVALSGMSVGLTISNIAFFALATLIPPVGAVSVVMLMAGAAFGAKAALDNEATRKREELIQRIKQLLQDLMRKVLSQAGRQFHQIAKEFEERTQEIIKETVDVHQTKLASRQQQLDRARRQTSDTNQSQCEGLKRQAKRLDQIVELLQDVMPQADEGSLPR